MKTIEVNGMIFEEAISKERIAIAVQKVADEINNDYKGRTPLFVCMLNGAFIFAADLFRKIELHSRITFVRLKSYEGTSTTGDIKEIVPLQESVEGRDIIIVEDIVDSGNTMKYYKEKLASLGAASVKVAVLAFKPETLIHKEAHPDYIGMILQPDFIIGCGFDIDGYERNHEEIYHLKK